MMVRIAVSIGRLRRADYTMRPQACFSLPLALARLPPLPIDDDPLPARVPRSPASSKSSLSHLSPTMSYDTALTTPDDDELDLSPYLDLSSCPSPPSSGLVLDSACVDDSGTSAAWCRNETVALAPRQDDAIDWGLFETPVADSPRGFEELDAERLLKESSKAEEEGHLHIPMWGIGHEKTDEWEW